MARGDTYGNQIITFFKGFMSNFESKRISEVARSPDFQIFLHHFKVSCSALY